MLHPENQIKYSHCNVNLVFKLEGKLLDVLIRVDDIEEKGLLVIPIRDPGIIGYKNLK